MSHNLELQLGSNVLAIGKRLCPDRFPSSEGQDKEKIAYEWGAALLTVPLPIQIWPEAVRWWALRKVTEKMCTPRDIREAAYEVRDQWESTPAGKKALERMRERKRQEREKRLAQGLPPNKHRTPTALLQGQQHEKAPTRIASALPEATTQPQR